MSERKKTRVWLLIVWAGILIGALVGVFRVYYGGSVGIRIVSKESFSFKDTVVDIDSLIGKPRYALEINHPEVIRQLEEMGVISF